MATSIKTSKHAFTVASTTGLSALKIDTVFTVGDKSVSATAKLDTGASTIAMSEAMETSLGLSVASPQYVQSGTATGSGGSYSTRYYTIDSIELPGGVVFEGKIVHTAPGLGGSTGRDVLIGMTALNECDFAVSGRGGKTTFSLRFPAKTAPDFTAAGGKPIIGKIA